MRTLGEHLVFLLSAFVIQYLHENLKAGCLVAATSLIPGAKLLYENASCFCRGAHESAVHSAPGPHTAVPPIHRRWPQMWVHEDTLLAPGTDSPRAEL